MPQPRPVRYAVVGLGHIAQAAVLPAFEHAENSELVAVVSGDEDKRSAIRKKYDLEHATDYDGYEDLLDQDLVDAAYLAVPNHLHREFTERTARHGVHVLCEKPMAVTEEDCAAMIEACDEASVRLMIAYRLHFEAANMEVAGIVRWGGIGEPRFFNSTFSQDVVAGDVRLMPIEQGGGTVYDMGVYCINAARYLFTAEPLAVTAVSVSRPDPRFRDCDESTSAILEFPDHRLAQFTSSFGAHRTAAYRVVGTDGEVIVEPAYGYATRLSYTVELGDEGEERTKRFPERDQFAPELIHFSDCIHHGRDPEPDGQEGLADVRVVRAVYEAARTGRRVELPRLERRRRPGPGQVISRPGVDKPEEVKASGPSDR